MKDRLPPYDLEAEQGAIGCLMIGGIEAFSVFQEHSGSGAEWFYELSHQTILKAIIRLEASDKAVDLITLQAHLKDRKELDQVGGLDYLNVLLESTPSASNLRWYLEILEEKFIRRKIISTCTELTVSAFDSAGTAGDLLDESERQILAIRSTKMNASAGIKELVQDAMETIEETLQRKGQVEGLSTGLADVDRITGGLKPGEMTVIAGYPGSGKTSLAMNISEQVMLNQKKSVGVFSLEMSSVSLVTRFISSHARVNIRNVASGFLQESDFSSLVRSAASISNASIWFEDNSDLSIQQLRSRARRLTQQHGLDLIVIDYLQLLNAVGGSRKVESRQQEVADISRGAKAMARELRIPVLALSQLNDDGKLRESRAIGQDADNVWVLKPGDSEQDEISVEDALPVDLRIVKSRNGPRGKVALVFLQPYTRFENAAKVDQEDLPTKRTPYND